MRRGAAMVGLFVLLTSRSLLQAAAALPLDYAALAEALGERSSDKCAQAEEALRDAGPEALAHVAKAAFSKLPEPRARARRILDAWNWPTRPLVERLGSSPNCPVEFQAKLLAEALRHPAPVEMDPLEAEILSPEKHLEVQEGVLAAAAALARLPAQLALAELAANLADADLPKYYTLTAIGAIGTETGAQMLLSFAEEDSTAGWISAPALGKLGHGKILEAALARSQKRIDVRRALKEDISVALYNHACLLALAGRLDEVREPLETALREGEEADATWARIDPDFRALRETPWFQEILARYGGYGLRRKGQDR